MVEARRKIEITILGRIYAFVSDEDQEHLEACAKAVDQLITNIMRASGTNNEGQVAVLAALRLASNCIKLESQLASYQTATAQLSDTVDKVLSCQTPL